MAGGVRYAILSNIHGNLPALKAVHEDALENWVNRLIHVGDLVGIGPFPIEVIEYCKDSAIDGVQGVYDETVVRGSASLPSPECDPIPAVMHEKLLTWTNSVLNNVHLNYLRGLPKSLELVDGNQFTHLYHGLPKRQTGMLDLDAPDAKIREVLSSAGADIVVLGHSHIPLHRQIESGHILFPGSVGVPRDGNPMASYALLDIGEDVRVEIRRVKYSIEKVCTSMKGAGFPEILCDWLRKGQMG